MIAPYFNLLCKLNIYTTIIEAISIINYTCINCNHITNVTFPKATVLNYTCRNCNNLTQIMYNYTCINCNHTIDVFVKSINKTCKFCKHTKYLLFHSFTFIVANQFCFSQNIS
jgi:hypothetical protein